MGWHYIAVQEPKEKEFWLHENFPGVGHTVTPVTIGAESPAELAKMLRAAADDVENFDPIYCQ